MAKQQVKPTISNNVGFVVPFHNIAGTANTLIDQLHAVITRSKYKATLVLADNGSTDGTVQAIKASKNFIAMEQQGLAKLIELPAKQAAGIILAQAEQAFEETDWIVVLDPKLPFNFSSFNAWYSQNQSKINTHTVYVGSRKLAAAGKKKPLGNSLYNLFRSLLTPINVYGTDAGFYLMSKEAFKQVAKYATSKGSSLNIELGYKATLMGYGLKEIPLESKEGEKFSVGAGAVIASAFKERIDWFVKIPIAQSFGAQKTDLKKSSGNHPIYRLIFMALTVFTLFLLPILSFDYGITWDEPDDVRYFETVYDYFATGGENKACLDTGTNAPNTNKHLIHYGTFVNLLCETVNQKISPYGVYETRHMIIALFSFIGIFFTGLIGRRVGNWRLGVLAFILLLLSPVYFGNGMNNHKDIPFAAFYMASIYFIIRFLSQLPKPRFGTMFFLGLCMGIIMSIRVPGVVVFVYFAMFVGLYWLLDARKKGNWARAKKRIPKYLKYVFLTLAWAYFVGIIFWPYALQGPFSHPMESFTKFSQFDFVHIWDVFEGQRKYMKDFIWYFVPKYILITTPLFVLAGMAAGVIGYIKLKKHFNIGFINILLFAAIFPVAYAIYKETNLYNSWRQMLFAYPPLVIFAAVGWEWLLKISKAKIVKIGVAVVLALLIIKPTIWMVKNHPYQYMYYNEIIGGVQGAYGYYELDYWCQSPREAITWLMEHEQMDDNKRYIVESNNNPPSAQYYADQIDSGQVYIDWSRDQELYQNRWDYAILTTRLFSKKQLLGENEHYPPGDSAWFPPKGTIHTINVDGVPICAIVKSENDFMFEGWRCIEQKKFDSAVYFYDKAIAYNPLEEEAYRNKGLAYLQMRKLNEAEAALKKAVELRPENFKALGYLGYVATQQGNPDQAILYLNENIKYKVNNSGAYSQLGDIYLQRQQYSLAEENYEKAFMYGGPTVQVLYGLGMVYLQTARYNEALGYAEACMRMQANYPNAYYLGAKAAEQLGDKAKAQQYYQKLSQLTGQNFSQ